MESFWVLLLFIGVAMANATQPPPITSDQVPPITYDQVVSSAIEIYNQQENPEFLFQLLEAEPQPDWDPSSRGTQGLKFSIKETVCRAGEKVDLNKCDYKEEGVDRDCSGFYSAEQNPATIIVQCEDIDKALNRITRSRWRRFWRKTKRFVRRHGATIARAALRFG